MSLAGNQVKCSLNLPSVGADVLLPPSLTSISGQEQFQGFPRRFRSCRLKDAKGSKLQNFFFFFNFQVYLNLAQLSEEPHVDACQQVVRQVQLGQSIQTRERLCLQAAGWTDCDSTLLSYQSLRSPSFCWVIVLNDPPADLVS